MASAKLHTQVATSNMRSPGQVNCTGGCPGADCVYLAQLVPGTGVNTFS